MLVLFEGDAGQVHFGVVDKVKEEVAHDGLGDCGDIVLVDVFCAEPVIESAELAYIIKVCFAG